MYKRRERGLYSAKNPINTMTTASMIRISAWFASSLESDDDEEEEEEEGAGEEEAAEIMVFVCLFLLFSLLLSCFAKENENANARDNDKCHLRNYLYCEHNPMDTASNFVVEHNRVKKKNRTSRDHVFFFSLPQRLKTIENANARENDKCPDHRGSLSLSAK